MFKSYPTPEEAETAGIKYAAENGPIDFDGMNCNDFKEAGEPECDGWDGEDRRCNCGNRRVSWDIETNLLGKYIAVARAY